MACRPLDGAARRVLRVAASLGCIAVVVAAVDRLLAPRQSPFVDDLVMSSAPMLELDRGTVSRCNAAATEAFGVAVGMPFETTESRSLVGRAGRRFVALSLRRGDRVTLVAVELDPPRFKPAFAALSNLAHIRLEPSSHSRSELDRIAAEAAVARALVADLETHLADLLALSPKSSVS
eukprot:CAMPEP_0197399996 /NCGR_PEP_ID=MMETSP1165-20131217/16150_1 /TAXON_ID=284809 /ORGANISM="Chrysocystis fragilis, Strain CCMP3189" /LENGTH=177 /DNA_ID=CAMNT_0042926031 /DNA_START=29 /DNA_END=562 /DNA_ORIENTATION=-